MRNGFSDAQCGFKAIRADVARVLLPLVEDQGWFFDTELLVVAERNGMRIHEVPVDWVDDPNSRVDVFSTAKADLLGIWRMLKRIARGDAPVEVPDPGAPRPASRGLGGQLVRFISIGVVSTLLFGLLFVMLVGSLGPLGADVVSLAICSTANIAANRRLTFSLRGRAGRARHYTSALALSALPLALTLLALIALDAVGIDSVSAQLAALTGANAVATVVRFVLLRTWVFGPLRPDRVS